MEPAPAPAPAAKKRGRLPDSAWPSREPLELDTHLRTVCATAQEDGRPVLLEFSAPWCSDCQLLKRLSSEPEAAAALSRFHQVTVNVGRFDRHGPLRNAFGIEAIAHWVVLRPDDCRAPVTHWPILKQGTLEPRSGKTSPRTSAEVAAWLAEAEGGGPR